MKIPFPRRAVCGYSWQGGNEGYICVSRDHLEVEHTTTSSFSRPSAVRHIEYLTPWRSLVFRSRYKAAGKVYDIPRFWGVSHRHYQEDRYDLMPIPLNILFGIPQSIWRWFKIGVR